jgi:hypothetical protein
MMLRPLPDSPAPNRLYVSLRFGERPSHALIRSALRLFGTQSVHLNHYPFPATANHDEIKRLVGVQVHLLMRHVRREVNEITGIHLSFKLKLLSPTYLAAPFDDVDSDLVTPMMNALRSSHVAGERLCRSRFLALPNRQNQMLWRVRIPTVRTWPF